MLTITVPTSDPSRLTPDHPEGRVGWLHDLGPTAWLLNEWIYDQARTVGPGDQLFVELDALAGHLGVNARVAERAFDRLSRFRVAYCDLARGQVVADGTLPRPRGRRDVAVHLHRSAS